MAEVGIHYHLKLYMKFIWDLKKYLHPIINITVVRLHIYEKGTSKLCLFKSTACLGNKLIGPTCLLKGGLHSYSLGSTL